MNYQEFELGLRRLLFLDSARNDVMLSEVEALKFLYIKLECFSMRFGVG